MPSMTMVIHHVKVWMKLSECRAIIVTKREKPIEQVAPRGNEPVRLRGALKGTVKITGDIVGPTGERWNADCQGRLTRPDFRLRSRRKPASKP